MKRIGCLFLLLPVLTGCAAVGGSGQKAGAELPPPKRAETYGPADYFYARGDRNRSQARMLEEMIESLKEDIEADKARRRRCLNKAAEVQRRSHLPAIAREAEYLAYVSEARSLGERIVKLRSVLADLRTHYGRFVADITRAERRGMDLEEGDVLAAIP